MSFDPEGFDNAIFDQSTPTEFASITKWDANLKIRNIQSPVNSIVNAYNITPSEAHPEGGREIEIVLRSKPVSNTIKIPLEKTNLTFYFQPPLTEEFLEADCDIWTETHIKTKDGHECWRPENVVGSYAVYHSTLRYNDAKNGKIMHIYRAQLIDALGAKAWAAFNRDANTTNQLIITLPQAFLDSAVYPVVIDPTFGKTSVGGSSGTLSNMPQGTRYTATGDGTINSLSLYLTGSGAGRYAQTSVYTNSGNNPNVRLEVSASEEITVDGWHVFSGLTVACVNGVPYWFLIGCSTTSLVWWYDSASDYYAQASNPYGTFPDPYNGSYIGNYSVSIYATYTPSGGGALKPACGSVATLMKGMGLI